MKLLGVILLFVVIAFVFLRKPKKKGSIDPIKSVKGLKL